jgi:hypothetical protein
VFLAKTIKKIPSILKYKLVIYIWDIVKGIGSILYLKNGSEKKMQKKTIKIISEVIIMRYLQLWHVVFLIF